MAVPRNRIRPLNGVAADPSREYVLYWMTAARRTTSNFALQHAVETSREIDRPLVILEPLRCGYRWACDRHHAFVIAGMRDNAERLAGTSVAYIPYLEPEPGAGKGLLKALAERACTVVADDYPCFFLPRMLRSAADQVSTAFEAVDSNGLFPFREADKTFKTAHSFRRHLQKNLLEHLLVQPETDPLKGVRFPSAPDLSAVHERWPAATQEQWADPAETARRLPIDHTVAAVDLPGGPDAAHAALARFLERRLSGYAEDRNHPDESATSELSPYLHFGHIGSHEVFAAIAAHEEWSPNAVSERTDGARAGWWGMSESAEAYLDQLVTWRELGFNMASREKGYDRYDSLPEWALETLEQHATDRREHLYDLDTFAAARTHDEVWNAAQTQLSREGVMHNYLRMLWGKKILEWSASPRQAAEIMVELNNRYALDGRDPNSYSGIFWVMGRYDRAWGPERPIFGKVRYMSSANTVRKLRLREYLERYAPQQGLF